MPLDYKANISVGAYSQPGSAAFELSRTSSTKSDANGARSILTPLENTSSLAVN